MGLKIRQKCAILKLISILFNFVSVSKLYVVFDGMDSILKMVHGQLLLAKADNCILSYLTAQVSEAAYKADIECDWIKS